VEILRRKIRIWNFLIEIIYSLFLISYSFYYIYIYIYAGPNYVLVKDSFLHLNQFNEISFYEFICCTCTAGHRKIATLFLRWISKRSLLSEWLVLTHGSINKNQSLGEQAAFRNLSKKSIATFLWPGVHASIGGICKRNKVAAQTFAWRITHSA